MSLNPQTKIPPKESKLERIMRFLFPPTSPELIYLPKILPRTEGLACYWHMKVEEMVSGKENYDSKLD